MTQDDTQRSADNSTQPASGQQGDSLYSYQSAGITEREGHVPVWLWIVTAALLVWGVYYLVSYWNAPVAT
jgi:hypothetical protein